MVTTVLLDELGLLVHPLVVGSGMRRSGVLFLTYAPAGRGGGRQRVIRTPTVAIGRRA